MTAKRTRGKDTTPPPASIDGIDHQIIELVQHDGRISHQAIADSVGLSRPAARTRLLRLLDARIVEVNGVVHPAVFGLNAYAHVAIDVTGPAHLVADVIATYDDAPFVSLTAGNQALVVELRSPDQYALSKTLAQISALAGVTRVHTSIYTSIIKDAYWPPQPYVGSTIDISDRQLLQSLQRDGRLSFVDLSKQTGLSTSAVRSRVSRLISEGVLYIGARIRPDVLGVSHLVGFGLSVQGDSSPVIHALRETNVIQYLASAIGQRDIIGTAVSVSIAETAAILDELRALPKVRSVETWTHLRFVKENYNRSPILEQDAHNLNTSTICRRTT